MHDHVVKMNLLRRRNRTSSSFFLCILLLHISFSCLEAHNNQHHPYRMIFSYVTMSGFAVPARRWKRAMQKDLQQAALLSTQATVSGEAAAKDEIEADGLAAKSVAEQEESDLLEREGNALITKSQVDEAKAVTLKKEGQALAVQATENEGESATLFTEAAAEEVLVEEDMTKATADAALAAKDEGAVDVDEVVVGTCQAVPGLDVVCDVLGGIAGVGLEAASIREAALAAEEFTAAAAAQMQEDTLATKATELQASVVEEEQESAAFLSEATAEKVQADEELAQGRADEVAAKELLTESIVDEESATEEQAEAVVEEDASANAWKEAAQHALAACWHSILLILVSAVALLFWLIRITKTIVLTVRDSVAARHEQDNDMSPKRRDLETISHIIHHVLIFTLFFGLWGGILLHVTLAESMGVIALLFVVSAAATQALLMHIIPLALEQYQQSGRHLDFGSSSSSPCRTRTLFLFKALREFCRRILVLFPLMVLEALILVVNAGSWVLAPTTVQAAQSRYLWVVLPTTLLWHYFYFCGYSASPSKREAPFLPLTESESFGKRLVDKKKTKLIVDYEAVGTTEPCLLGMEAGDVHDEQGNGLTETEELLSADFGLTTKCAGNTANMVSPGRTEDDQWFYQVILGDLRRLPLMLLMEIVLASVMLAFMRQTMPILKKLWPTTKTMILMAVHSHWYIVLLFSVVALLVLVCACREDYSEKRSKRPDYHSL